MRIELLVEGQTDKVAIGLLLPKIIGAYGNPHKWQIHKHRGIGKLLDNPLTSPSAKDPTLLHNLPSKLRAYGKENDANLAIVVLVDLDDRTDCVAFKASMVALLKHCKPQPRVIFRIAIEELEAWYLGDRDAVLKTYPSADCREFDSYNQDDQCGTWEKMADVVYPGGRHALKRARRDLDEKRVWAKNIVPNMKIENNKSKSFQVFVDGVRALVSS